ncbi:MAG TPA: acetylglutamate kinase [Candidatus Stercoripulliclostridium merdipullorum]|uniref:Acetylglutamate kinase n=1 Tax=Candidatus Stercoripulliclostridium merdipullorum TaxID=2840952 RepID=A0A9D1NBQ9_9FIRM|nr:acetylglutamate kinase [Candidatus Stercoripulliclostridium merdipullorum]
MEADVKQKAEILVQALPYIHQYNGKILVIKYGGNAMINETLKKAVMSDLVLLYKTGVKIVLVHGGGPEINEALKKMGIETKFVGGLRQTDRATVEVVQMVLAGKVNKDLVNLIENEGGKAMGLSGIDGHMLECRPVSAELGYVGAIERVDVEPVLSVLEAGYIPVISTVGCDKEGNVYNINADTVAAAIAGSLKAEALISMTDIRGILRDKNDENSLIPVVQVSEAPQLIREGIISGGMIPKIECSVEAIRRGVSKVFIIDGRMPHAILIEILSDQGIGTMFC